MILRQFWAFSGHGQSNGIIIIKDLETDYEEKIETKHISISDFDYYVSQYNWMSITQYSTTR